ncbi:hypothetical protein N5853_12000 [Bartonella sp. HY329]|uniref:DUF6694 family lipoprotein n=1 Tax=unclassified Bartonella TaxID=2645622 RepID=UPI0021C568ED|nr:MULTISPECIES: DUF6694 family lipoprotein [unclassified Bartonella]UXM94803.1 hypothetical protein N5853_12000 [Bartonella sp. HY329]UXN09126.1 hypothetical protein N5852_12010 [Bartonella sp. HY328]
MKKLLCMLLLTVSLAACGSGEPKADMSTNEKMEQSLDEMSKKLSPEDATKLKNAVVAISINLAMANAGDQEKTLEALKEKLNGKTAKEIIDMAK